MDTDKLYYRVLPGENRVRVAKHREVSCIRCYKVIRPGKWLFNNGYCYRCEHKRIMKEVILAERLKERKDKEFRSVVSE